MVDVHRFVDRLAWSLAAVSLAGLGCSAGNSKGSGGNLGVTPPVTTDTPAGPAFGGSGAPGTSAAMNPQVTRGGAGTGVTALGSSGAPGVAPGVKGSSGAPSVVMMPAVTMMGASGAGAAGAPATPGTDDWTPMSHLDASGNLMKPADGEGYQMDTTAFDLAPGQEVYSCFHVATPNDAVFPVGEWDGQMTKGSHHFILYRDASDTTASGMLTQGGCTLGFGGSTWLYTQGTPRSHLTMPDAVAMELQPHERIVFDMHYINTTTETIHAHIGLNMYKVTKTPYQKAGSQVSFNLFGITGIPPGRSAFGGDCTPPPGTSFFIMQTHTHKNATDAVVTRKLANGQLGEELVHTINWDMPMAHEWHSAPFLTFGAGETYHYKCVYNNMTGGNIMVGTSAATNEMCMSEGYYFPANGDPPACNDTGEESP